MLNPSAPSGKDTKYARPERERRFVLSAPAPGVAVRLTTITDRYIMGTRLRLRRSAPADGGQAAVDIIYKLTQKVPAPAGGLGLITTMYLTRAEYEILAELPAAVLRKTRHSVPPLGVDIFDDGLAGLILAEAEFETDAALETFAPPPFAVAEVTSDVRFTGGYLATARRVEVAAALRDVGIDMIDA